MLRPGIALGLLLIAGGCSFLPEISRQPVVRNPFPQLARVGVAPFFNLSAESTVDGRQFAVAYFQELQATPGFEVVPVGVVEQAMLEHRLTLRDAAEAQRLAQLLGVDAIVVGAITDYTPYYPPRCGLQIEWYAANPCFHPIPPGYGLPWGTPGEEEIPGALVYEAEMALAREQMRTQEPLATQVAVPLPAAAQRIEAAASGSATTDSAGDRPQDDTAGSSQQQSSGGALRLLSGAAGNERAGASGADGASSVIAPAAATTGGAGAASLASAPTIANGVTTGTPQVENRPPDSMAGLPPDWPDPRGFFPPGPSAVRPACEPTEEPVLRHTRIYNGHDADFTTALRSYAYFRDDARFGGWQGYLQRSDDFIRFCCHLHLSEMLTARGGAAETRVVWRWPTNR